MIFSGPEIVEELLRIDITHVVWIPDSDTGQWEDALAASTIQLLRVCREGEAWPLAAGLHLAGKSPLIMMQTTGFFESGDALRNILYDLKLPLAAIIGARNWLNAASQDTAKRFAEPILNAWDIRYELIASSQDQTRLASHLLTCREEKRPGIILLAE